MSITKRPHKEVACNVEDTTADATVIDIPSSTKNAEGKRDPEMHQTRKGNQRHFGAKLHVSVDAGSGYIHTTIVTAANVADGAVAADLICKDDHVACGDVLPEDLR